MIKKAIALILALIVGIIIFFGFSTKADTAKTDTEDTYPLPEIEYYGAVYPLTYIEYEEICRVVMGEAGGERFEGQQAVAQAILNTCKITGLSPLEVVEDYHYTKNRPEASDSVREAVLSVFTEGNEVIHAMATIFYSPENVKGGYSEYHESQTYVCTIGGHRFFIENENLEEDLNV